MSAAPKDIARQIAAQIPARTERQLIALAGPPASGKSTVAEALVAELAREGRPAGLLPMDGFHLDNAILDRLGLRARKGSPDTFDLAGFTALLHRVKAEPHVYVPTFDRSRDAAIAGSAEITPEQNIIVVEGNYLLLDRPGWRDLAGLWDFAVFLDVPEDVLETRLLQRWSDHGFDDAGARQKAEGNDLPNARLVAQNRLTDAINLTVTV